MVGHKTISTRDAFKPSMLKSSPGFPYSSRANKIWCKISLRPHDWVLVEDVDLGLVALSEILIRVTHDEATLKRFVDVQASADLDDPPGI